MARASKFDAVEWDLNYIPVPLAAKRIRDLRAAFKKSGIKVRYHLPHSSCDISSPVKHISQTSHVYLQLNIEQIARLGGEYCVMHFGSTNNAPPESLTRLCKLVEFAHSLGVMIAIENLMTGITANAARLKTIALRSGTTIALDIGHLGGVEKLRGFLEILGNLVTHVHFYRYQDRYRNHVPFLAGGHEVARVVKLLKERCSASWWTCEMDSVEDCIRTRKAAIDALRRLRED